MTVNEKELSELKAIIEKLSHDYGQQLSELKAAGEQTKTQLQQRMEDVRNSFAERLAAKEATVQLLKDMSDSIQKQNDAIQKQMATRFNFVTGMTGFIALAFAANFSYNLYQATEVLEARRFLKDGTEILADDTTAYSGVLSSLARADILSTQGDREFQRGSYLDADTFASQAIEELKSAAKITGLDVTEVRNSAVYDNEKCRRVASDLPALSTSLPARVRDPKLDKSFGGLGPKTLRRTVIDSLFSAYDLRARSNFFGEEKTKLRDDGTMLLALNNARPEGYHWLGLAAEFGHSKTDYAEAIECFKQSTRAKSFGNKDHVNLAELSLFQGDYDRSRSHSIEYLAPLKFRFVSPTEVVSHFYLTISNFLSSQPVSLLQVKSPKAFREALGKLNGVKLQGTFLATDLQDFLKSEAFNKLPDAKKSEIRKTADCLVSGVCEG